MDITEKLNHLGEVVYSRWPYINHGGCCVYAALVAEELVKHNIDSVGIVAAYDAAGTAKSIDTIRSNIRKNTVDEWQSNGVSFNHVGLEFKIKGRKKHYDTRGVVKAALRFDSMPIYKGRLKLDDMKKLASRRAGWNSSFNRRNIPALRQLIKEHLAVDSM